MCELGILTMTKPLNIGHYLFVALLYIMPLSRASPGFFLPCSLLADKRLATKTSGEFCGPRGLHLAMSSSAETEKECFQPKADKARNSKGVQRWGTKSTCSIFKAFRYTRDPNQTYLSSLK